MSLGVNFNQMLAMRVFVRVVESEGFVVVGEAQDGGHWRVRRCRPV